MSKLILTDEVIAKAKQMIVNLEVAKTMDRKTQTRRIAKGKNKSLEIFKMMMQSNDKNVRETAESEFIKRYAKHQVGVILWVREPAKVLKTDGNFMKVKYLADGLARSISIPNRFIGDDSRLIEYKSKWLRECQGVPNGCIKEMARIFLKVTNVRVERLQDITLDDIKKEGLYHTEELLKKGVSIENQLWNGWVKLWNSTAPKGYKWEDNPYVFVYEFEREI